MFGRGRDDTTLQGTTIDPYAADLAIVTPEVDRLLDLVALFEDEGMRVQLIEAIANKLPKGSGDTPSELFDSALDDLVDDEEDELSSDRIVTGALSLEFLMRYATELPVHILPSDKLISDHCLQACLRLFHAGYGQ